MMVRKLTWIWGTTSVLLMKNLSQNSNVTSGRIYWNVLKNERAGYYEGGTVQVIPHITNEIKNRIYAEKDQVDVSIVEIGGTVGDIESQPFLEAIRQFATEVGRQNCSSPPRHFGALFGSIQ